MTRWSVALAVSALVSCALPTPNELPPLLDPTGGRRAGPSVLSAGVAQRDTLFSNMDRYYPHRVVRAAARVRPLLAGAPLTVTVPIDSRSRAIDEAMADQQATGLLVLHDGRVRLERYARSHDHSRRWPAFSVTKSFTSTLVGAALQDGAIHSVHDPVTRYIPELIGTGYDGVTVRHLLTMTSGVRWNEDETDPHSDLARFNRDAPNPGMDATLSYIRTLPRAHPPGSRWNYNTAETNLIGLVVERATDRTLADYLSRKVWQPLGMERDAIWVTDITGQEIGGGGLVAALRDLARFGQFVLNDGMIDGRHVVPAGWFRDAGTQQADFGSTTSAYGYQWWIYPDGSFAGAGIFGQGLFIDRNRRLVVALAGNWPVAWNPELARQRQALYRAVQRSIDVERRNSRANVRDASISDLASCSH